MEKVNAFSFSIINQCKATLQLKYDIVALDGKNELLPQELKVRIKKIISLLRLYFQAPLNPQYGFVYSSNGIEFSDINVFGMKDRVIFSSYAVKPIEIKTDKKVLATIFKELLAYVPINDDGNFDKKKPIGIAFNSFENALLNVSDPLESRIGDIIIGLESLLLKESQELSFRLSIRVAKLLQVLGLNGTDIKKYMEEAYSVRSSVFHGGKTNFKTKDPPQKIYENTLLCLRILIVIFLKMGKDDQRDEFIELIDKAFVDEVSNKKLKNEVNQFNKLVSKFGT